MSAALEELKAEGIAAQRLTVSHAFHSPLLDPMLDGLRTRGGADRLSSSADRPCVQPHGPDFRGGRGARRRVLAAAQPRGGALRGRHPGAGRARLRRLRGSGAGADPHGDGPQMSAGRQGRLGCRRCARGRTTGRAAGRPGHAVRPRGEGGLARLRPALRPQSRCRCRPTRSPATATGWRRLGARRRVRRRGLGPRPAIRCSASGCRRRCHGAVRGAMEPPQTPLFADHKVQGSVVVARRRLPGNGPGRRREVFGEGAHVLENVTFPQPLFLSEGRPHAVELSWRRRRRASRRSSSSRRRPTATPRRRGPCTPAGPSAAPGRGAAAAVVRRPGRGAGAVAPRNSTRRPATAT